MLCKDILGIVCGFQMPWTSGGSEQTRIKLHKWELKNEYVKTQYPHFVILFEIFLPRFLKLILTPVLSMHLVQSVIVLG